MFKLINLLCIAFIINAVSSIEFTNLGRAQTVSVIGALKCDGEPAAGVLVKLYDHDTFTLDDKLASGHTNGNGEFRLTGTGHEFTRITPEFNIYHDCDDWLPCQRKVKLIIPKSYINYGDTPGVPYDAGVIELAGKFKGETRDCFHK